jgi:uncharacterized protein
MRIGIVSDTHGLLRPEVLAAFEKVDHILHAGDIGGEGIIRALRKLAPVTSVLGNNDDATGTEMKRIRVEGLRILVTHILPRPQRPDRHVVKSLQKEPADVVVFGHSHLPHNETIDGILYFNPASAGPRRFNLPVAIGMMEKKGRAWNARHIALDEKSVDTLRKMMNQLSR